jgi:hypothetical protein
MPPARYSHDLRGSYMSKREPYGAVEDAQPANAPSLQGLFQSTTLRRGKADQESQ